MTNVVTVGTSLWLRPREESSMKTTLRRRKKHCRETKKNIKIVRVSYYELLNPKNKGPAKNDVNRERGFQYQRKQLLTGP